MDKKNDDKIGENEIGKYFPFEHVVQQTMEIYEELLGLKITKIECEAWEPEVTCYLVNDEDSDELIGEFYLDVFKREGKQEAAFASEIMRKSQVGPSKMKAISYMYSNFEKTGTVWHAQVVTFFHEFGHVMHQVLSKSKYARLSGSSCETDFGELPSQMLENWVWNKDIVKRLSHHHETGAQIPDDLLEKKLARRTGRD